MSAYEDLMGGVQANLTYDQWLAQQQEQVSRMGGDAGGYFDPNGYSTGQGVSYTIPGYGDGWQMDASHDGQWFKIDPTKSTPGLNNHVSILHDDGSGGVSNHEEDWNIAPRMWEHVLGDYIMPAAVAAITGFAGYSAVGGAMAAGAADGAAAGAAAGSGEGAAAGAAAGEGTAGAAGTTAGTTAAEAAPTFTYGTQAPAWSQAGNTALGSGMYGTDTASMAGIYGTTADAGAGIGSGVGSGVAADGGAWAGAGGGWQGIASQANSGISLADALKYGKNAYQAYNALTGAKAGGAQSLGSGLASYGSSKGSAPAFSSSVQMPQQAQAAAAPAPFLIPTAPLSGFAAQDTSKDELNNSSNILRLAAALRGQTA